MRHALLLLSILLIGCTQFHTKTISRASLAASLTPNSVPTAATPSPTPSPQPVVGGAGCGLQQAAFCDTFDEGPSLLHGRAGDLDPSKWTIGRLAPADLNGIGVANPVRVAPIPNCRSSFTSPVYPPYDTLICDPDASGNRQLMTAVAIQNYGNNSYMIEQPFDFAGRTGKIVFDVEAAMTSGLGAFPGVEITDQPVPAPAFQEFHNFEAGPIPQNGVMLKFTNNCGSAGSEGQYATLSALGNLLIYNNYVMTMVTPSYTADDSACLKAKPGFLNHIEIDLSQTHIDVYGADYSPDGVSIPNLHLIYSADINVSFTRGYVHMSAHNHATIKYGYGPDGVIHWDNIGFDGPIISGDKYYEVADNTTMGTYVMYGSDPIMNLGYLLRDASTGNPGMFDPYNLIAPLQISGVDTSSSTSARVSMNIAFSPLGTADTTWGLQYRFNGGTWRTRNLTAIEANEVNGQLGNPDPGSAANLLLLMDVPFTDIKNGTNTLEVLPVNAPMNYPPVMANIDLILSP